MDGIKKADIEDQNILNILGAYSDDFIFLPEPECTCKTRFSGRFLGWQFVVTADNVDEVDEPNEYICFIVRHFKLDKFYDFVREEFDTEPVKVEVISKSRGKEASILIYKVI